MLPLRETRQGDLVPAFFDGKVHRFVGRIRTTDPKPRIEEFATRLMAARVPVFDMTTLEEYDRMQTAIPILDQGSHGSCVGYANATAMMKARDLSGHTFVELSGDSLYAQINHGRDMGSDPGDAIKALEETGICPSEYVPDGQIHWNQ